LVTSNDELAERARILRNHGAEKQYFHKLVGGNFRLDALQAAFLNVKLPHLAGYTARRRENAAFYNQALSATRRSCADEDVRPMEIPGNYHIWNQYTLRVSGRDQLRRHLTERGIGSAIYYPVPLHLQECFTSAGPLPVAEQLAKECLSLPIYPELTREQLAWVADAVREFAATHVR